MGRFVEQFHWCQDPAIHNTHFKGIFSLNYYYLWPADWTATSGYSMSRAPGAQMLFSSFWKELGPHAPDAFCTLIGVALTTEIHSSSTLLLQTTVLMHRLRNISMSELGLITNTAYSEQESWTAELQLSECFSSDAAQCGLTAARSVRAEAHSWSSWKDCLLISCPPKRLPNPLLPFSGPAARLWPHSPSPYCSTSPWPSLFLACSVVFVPRLLTLLAQNATLSNT